MSAEEFWKDDPQLFNSYRISFINKKKREMEEEDYKCWLRGLYVYDGNSKIADRLNQTVYNGFAGFGEHPKFDKHKIEGYPKKPYAELEKDKQKEKKEKERTMNYKQFENSLLYFGTMKQRYLENIEKRKKKGE